LKQRGTVGIRGLGIVLEGWIIADVASLIGMSLCGVSKKMDTTCHPSEFERVFKFFDKNNDGKISYDEFLLILRGDLNPRRKVLLIWHIRNLTWTGQE